ncbi:MULTISPECIES: uracil-xanthine permease family protein [Terrisporobacter]|uniref:Purine permease n=1 Tax=Terrisporobacter muris TaxID=2963284 RepID=A0A9X2S033_9FIRM|nr:MULTISPECIES: nucleobase:cation symporter-2 family protein [Terrisporobacter]MCR1821370.1 purine permease [Terrisporobacter muris]MDY3372883.1 nucleobase:cation symporter-2 family protein [Terrisporobacter othiniensis]
MSVISCSYKDVFEEKVSRGKLLILAFQHVLTMCPASIAVPLILGSALNLDNKTVAFLVSANLFTSGISVLIQTFGFANIGSKLPLVMGASFAPLGVMISIGGQYGLNTLFGAIIGSGILIFVISFFMEKILVFFPNVVVGSFVTLIGISLIPVAFKDLAGGEGAANFGAVENIMLGGLVLIIIIGLNQYGKGLVRSLSLLIGIIIGTIIAFALGMVDLTPVAQASWFEIINPAKFGAPKFRIDAILMMTIFCVINLIQCIGVFSVLDEVCQTNTDSSTKIKGLRGVAMGQIFAGLFCSVPSTMFNENVGLIELTNVKSRNVIKMAGLFLIIIGFFPKVAALITIVPKPVMGGATISLFGIILTAGISILSKVDFSTGGNFTIVGISLAVGVGVTVVPNIFDAFPSLLSMLLSNGLFMVSITAIILNIVFNFKDIKKSLVAN